MWQKLPLNTKLVISLLLVQATALALGVFLLTKWIDDKRLTELRRHVDALSDTVEGAVSSGSEGLTFSASGAVRELSDDEGFYFELILTDGRVLAAGRGPAPATRANLHQQFVRKDHNEPAYAAQLPTGRWLVQTEPIRRVPRSAEVLGTSYAAINAQPVIDELTAVNRLIVLGAVAILIATSLGSGLVVSYTTSNLRAFSREIRRVKPPFFQGQITLAPQSSEERLLFDSYSEMIRAVQASGEAQRLFIAHASHELKTPIAAALSALEVTLVRPRSAADYEQTCRAVLAEVVTLRRLSTALLDLAQLDKPVESAGSRACDVAAVARAVVDRWAKAAQTRRIVLRCEIKAEATVTGSAEEWEVVLGNLVDNSVKYGRDRGRVDVTVQWAAAGRLEVVIADDGVGMSADQVARLGEVFFRADVARSGGKSFGLGFAHVTRIAARLGAEIKVDSHAGQGTTVTVHPELAC